jgi:hypothetical protein
MPGRDKRAGLAQRGKRSVNPRSYTPTRHPDRWIVLQRELYLPGARDRARVSKVYGSRKRVRNASNGKPDFILEGVCRAAANCRMVARFNCARRRSRSLRPGL